MERRAFNGPQKVKMCPECGERIQEKTEVYLVECDRCLAKREE